VPDSIGGLFQVTVQVPLDLLEDDSLTDIHGSIALYSNTAGAGSVPEPGSAALLGGAVIVLALARRLIHKEENK